MSDSTNSRFLTTEEASLTAKVSLETITKYKELGLLRAFRVNGQEQFTEDEIKLVFNSRRKTEIKDIPQQLTDSTEHAQIKETQNEKNEEPPTLKEILSETNVLNNSNEATENTKNFYKSEFKIENTNVIRNNNNADYRGTFDIPSIELLELTRTLKDQLETVKEERNWLRRRVEKLESSIEREQMIAISKTETLRNLVDQSKQNKNPWSFLLPWNK
jgi:hypothetical protein